MSDLLLPTIPVLPGMVLQDHIAYVVRREDFPDFTDYWESRGYEQLPALITHDYPARHIGFVRRGEEHSPMIASSVSDDAASPINEFLRLYGSHHIDADKAVVPGKVQHIAYQIDTTISSIETVRAELVGQGIVFMTPILTYESDGGGVLKQTFCSCNVPWGPFVELVERRQVPVVIASKEGTAGRQGFGEQQIDALYRYYDEYSRKLIVKM